MIDFMWSILLVGIAIGGGVLFGTGLIEKDGPRLLAGFVALLVALTVSETVVADVVHPTPDDVKVLHKELFSKFVPKVQKNDTLVEWTGHEAQIIGDCDDYYTAAYNRMAHNGWPVTTVLAIRKKDRTRHIMACTRTENKRLLCLDNNSKTVRSRPIITKHYRAVDVGKWKRFTFKTVSF